MAALDDLVELRLDTLGRHPEVISGLRATEQASLQLQACLDQAEHVELLRTAGLPRAAVVVTGPMQAPLGAAESRCVVEIRPGDAEARRWAGAMVQRLAPGFDTALSLTLDVAHEPLLPALAEADLHLQLLVLWGDPEASLRRLTETERPSPDLETHGLSLSPLRDAEQVDQILELRKRYFSENPEHGALNAQRAITEEVQAAIDQFVGGQLRDAAASPLGTHFVFARENEILGSFELNLDQDHPLFGVCAGVGIMLHPSIHGLGLGRLAYRTLLERMVALKVRVFRGITANAAVIHLARRMKRPLRGFKLGLGQRFGPEHFRYAHR